ncbi:MAG: tRNA uridine-5-carboxymethylaminomethyl(34) synthesis enzyme MnmG [Phycisphaeraceae bacterium]|nr:tRNA uridine-5-carboxymethylaminomethyl(34) synthesis enzyme MnmG [Phycisphaeraceae bacterium]
MHRASYQVIVIGGGHAGVEAAWAAANMLGEPFSVALVTLDAGKIGVMSCNPAIGGLAKGQIVREVDALGGVMGLAADATGIQFKVLNTSKGPAVHGPRAQCDKHAYAEAVRRLIHARPEIRVVEGSVEELLVNADGVQGVIVRTSGARSQTGSSDHLRLEARSVVLTTGTFMRGLMHTGESRVRGGRFGESSADGISGALARLGFELGRLKTGTPPRLRRGTIDWDALEVAQGDAEPLAFSELSGIAEANFESAPSIADFPTLPQVSCRITHTNGRVHDVIRSNLHRAPMYSGQIESAGPRYCPSIEDKVVRFADKTSHQVFLEPESHRDDWVYCNGISTSLPADVQDQLVRSLPGCANAEILRYGYAVEYDMVRPHQIGATAMTKTVDGLFLAGQINGTSGYEEAAAQGVLAGINASLFATQREPITIGRDEAYIGVLMDDLVTRTPVEPYRMFTSRAEHRLVLRADNAPERLTPLADRLGLLSHGALGGLRRERFARRSEQIAELNRFIDSARADGVPLADAIRRPTFTSETLGTLAAQSGLLLDPATVRSVHAERQYRAYIVRQSAEIRRHLAMERRRIPSGIDFSAFAHLRTEARHALNRFRPETFGQAARLEGVTPADITLLSVLLSRTGGANLSQSDVS